jgi:hypothetical protein
VAEDQRDVIEERAQHRRLRSRVGRPQARFPASVGVRHPVQRNVDQPLQGITAEPEGIMIEVATPLRL